MKPGFHPIGLEEYARLHTKANPGEKYSDVVERLKQALARYEADERCHCGEPNLGDRIVCGRRHVLYMHYGRGVTVGRLRDRRGVRHTQTRKKLHLNVR